MIKHPLLQKSLECDIKSSDLTSMVDILFIIIIFFLLTIGASIRTLNVSLPQSQENIKLTESGKNIVLQITEDGYSIENNTNLNLEQLKPILLNYTKTTDAKLLIASDKDAKAQTLLELLAFLKNNNVDVANILFDKKH